MADTPMLLSQIANPRMNTGFSQGLIQSPAAGQEFKRRRDLSGPLLQQEKIRSEAMGMELAKAQGRESIIKELQDFDSAGDMEGRDEALRKLSYIDPKGSAEIYSIMGNLDQKTRLTTGMHFNNAIAACPVDDVECQNAQITRGRDTLPAGHPFQTLANGLMAMPYGEKRQTALFEGLDLLKQYGFIPRDPNIARRGGLSEEQWNRQMEDQERRTDLQEFRAMTGAGGLDLKERKFERSKETFAPGMEKIYNEVEKDYRESSENYSSAIQRAHEVSDFASKMTSGWMGTAKEFLKGATGMDDYESVLKKRLAKLKMKGAIDLLPPGVASDADIKLALITTLDTHSSPEAWIAYLNSLSLNELANRTYHETKADYLSDGGTQKGWIRYWRDNGETITAPILEKGKMGFAPGGVNPLKKGKSKDELKSRFKDQLGGFKSDIKSITGSDNIEKLGDPALQGAKRVIDFMDEERWPEEEPGLYGPRG